MAKRKKTKKKSSKKKSEKTSAKKELKRGPQIRLPSVRAELDINELKSIEDELRDLMNWIAVFEQEYDLPREVVDRLLTKIHSVAKKIGWLRCKP